MDSKTEAVTIAFGGVLKELRKGLGLTQTEMADRLEIGLALMKRYESGNTKLLGSSGFPISLLVRLADVTGTPLADLSRRIFSDAKLSQRGSETSLPDALLTLPPKVQEALLELAEAKPEDSVLGNPLNWALEFASLASRLPAKKRASLELQVRQDLVKDPGLSEQEEQMKKRMLQLLQFTIEAD